LGRSRSFNYDFAAFAFLNLAFQFRLDQRDALLQLGDIGLIQFLFENGFRRFWCFLRSMIVLAKERGAFIRRRRWCPGWCGFAVKTTSGASVGECEKRFLNSRLSALLVIAHCRNRPCL